MPIVSRTLPHPVRTLPLLAALALVALPLSFSLPGAGTTAPPRAEGVAPLRLLPGAGTTARTVSGGGIAARSLPRMGVAGLGAQTPEELRRQAEERLGRDLTDQEILQMLRQSGLSPDEVRRRLAERGFDPAAAEPWLAVLEGRASQVPPGSDPAALVNALMGRDAARALGRAAPGRIGALPTDTLRFEDALAREGRFRRPEDQGPPVFGREIFRRATSQFRPVTTGPVPPDYRVGPGDELILVLTGAVEQAYELRVSPEGWVVIPEVGRVLVNGKTLEELRETLFERLSQSYASLKEPEPTTRMDVSVGELRTNQVFVIGEVEEPAAYVVSSLATALTALYHAGGPTRNGSFRQVRVNRGGETVRTLDLYRYLVEGKADEDIRLEQGDIVFVPPAGRRVELQGPVVRPGLYELAEGESLADLLRYAGGVLPHAELRRVQIRRILPPEERAPGLDRAVLDVPVGDLEEGGRAVPLRDGDLVNVFAVLDEAMNRVTVTGGVWRPGTYGATDSTRLWDVIEAAGGLLPDAFEGRAQIQRLQEDYTRRLIPVSLTHGPDGEPLENPLIEGMDQVIVYARRELREDRAVSIGGWVREPGVYPYVEGMTVADLVLKAGGLRTGAYTAWAEVARVVISQERTDTLTRHFEVGLDSTLIFDSSSEAQEAVTGRPAGEVFGGEASRFVLRNLDAVYVRQSPGFEPQRRVAIAGEVRFPGPYSLQTRQDRLTDLIRRAGGLTGDAYAEGFQLWRMERARLEADTLGAAQIAGRAVGTADGDGGAQAGGVVGGFGAAAWPAGQAAPADTGAAGGAPGVPFRPPGSLSLGRTRVGIDFAAALRNPEGPDNILVEPGDSLFVPHYIPTVDVRGAVGVETKVLYREGAGLSYYIDQAGGFAQNADEGRTRVRFANGEVATRSGGFLFFGGGIPDPDPGSMITVPFEPPGDRGLSTGQWITLITSVLGTAATIAIAASN